MAKGILEFNLEKPSDASAHKRAINSTKAYICLHDISELLRSYRKHGISMEAAHLTNEELIEHLEDKFYLILENNDVSLGDLE